MRRAPRAAGVATPWIRRQGKPCHCGPRPRPSVTNRSKTSLSFLAAGDPGIWPVRVSRVIPIHARDAGDVRENGRLIRSDPPGRSRLTLLAFRSSGAAGRRDGPRLELFEHIPRDGECKAHSIHELAAAAVFIGGRCPRARLAAGAGAKRPPRGQRLPRSSAPHHELSASWLLADPEPRLKRRHTVRSVFERRPHQRGRGLRAPGTVSARTAASWASRPRRSRPRYTSRGRRRRWTGAGPGAARPADKVDPF
jgi:hypothetical protein